MDHAADIQILQELKDGSAKAYDALFLKYYKLLCLNAYFFLKDEEEAKELVQLFFVDMWEKKGYAHLDGDIKGYLYQAVKNRCLNQLRKTGNDRKKEEELALNWQEEDLGDESDVPEYLYDLLEEALDELPRQRREALILVYLQHRRYQEAADVMGISINSLKTHLRLGLRNLRERINNKEKA